MRDRWDAALRWMLVPWTQAAIVVALVGAAATPALLMSAADVWTVSAGDEFAQRLVEEITPAEAGVVVITNAVFSEEPTVTAARTVTDRMASIEGIDPAVVTLWTLRASGEVGRGAEDVVNPGVPLRVMARDGAEGLEQAKSANPALAVLDIGLPEMDGLGLVLKIRASEIPEIAKLNAVALTAYAYTSDRVKALKAGFNNYVSKPVDGEELLTILEMYLPETSH